MNNREKLDMADTTMATVLKMIEGNVGAAKVLGELLVQEKEKGILYMLHLDDMNMRGTQIWVAYKDYCDSNMQTFIEKILDRDKDMVALVNARCPQYRAVISGGSF